MPTEKKQWYVLRTKPRGEKKLAARLEKVGIACYCPTRTETRQWSDRKKKVDVPVLPSMILVYLTVEKRSMVFDHPGALRYLFWLGKPAVVRQEEVDALKESLNADGVVTEVEALKPGQTLDMTKMGFKQVKGTVKYVSDNACWVVLEGLGYVVKMKRSRQKSTN